MQDVSGDTTMIFLSSAAMWPSEINERFPGARFVARGAIPSDAASSATTFSSYVQDDIWGIVLEIPGETASTGSTVVTTDDSRQIAVELVDEHLIGGDPKGALAASRYWELPPVWIDLMKSALAAAGSPVEDEEPRDDGALT